MSTKIEWAEETWNCLTGCSLVSPGCHNCYAMYMAHRLEAMALADIAKGRDPGRKRKYIGTTKKLDDGRVVWTGKVNLDEDALTIPMQKKGPTIWFVNSMSDLFHDDVPDYFIARVFAVMETCFRHTFQVLTKRAERMQRILSHPHFPSYVRKQGYDWLGGTRYQERGPFWRNNVWLGVSCEDQKRADERIPHLLNTPAAVRFLSCEPLLGPIDLTRWLHPFEVSRDEQGNDLGSGSGGSDLHWVIVGGESGTRHRPCDVFWIRDIIRQCKAASVPVFVKQLGAGAKGFSIHELPSGMMSFVDSKGGDPAEWPEDLRVREFPNREAI